MEFSWTGPLRVAGAEIALGDYPRMSNPWAHVEFENQDLLLYDPDTRTGVFHGFESGERRTFRAPE